MITRILPNINPTINNRSTPRPVFRTCAPSFRSVSPSFGNAEQSLRGLIQNDAPLPLSIALDRVMRGISVPDVHEIRQAFLNPDSGIILKNMYINAKKVDPNTVNLKVFYKDEDAGIEGGFRLASGSLDEIREITRKENFFAALKKKLIEVSDKVLYDKPRRLDD